MELDYRALGNAGMWCVGRLQTDADYARVVEGMGGGDSTKSLAAVVKRLSQRWFVLRDARAGAPLLFQPRWAMSLLRGPMTRAELERARLERSAPVSSRRAPLSRPHGDVGPPASLRGPAE